MSVPIEGSVWEWRMETTDDGMERLSSFSSTVDLTVRVRAPRTELSCRFEPADLDLAGAVLQHALGQPCVMTVDSRDVRGILSEVQLEQPYRGPVTLQVRIIVHEVSLDPWEHDDGFAAERATAGQRPGQRRRRGPPGSSRPPWRPRRRQTRTRRRAGLASTACARADARRSRARGGGREIAGSARPRSTTIHADP
jgi:hypothetical protein